MVDRAGRHSRSLPHWLAKLSEWLQLGRLGQHKQQAVVAGLAGILTDYLYQIERDLKLPSHTVLFELAHLLDIPLSALLGKAPSGNPSGRAVTAARNDLRKRAKVDNHPFQIADSIHSTLTYAAQEPRFHPA